MIKTALKTLPVILLVMLLSPLAVRGAGIDQVGPLIGNISKTGTILDTFPAVPITNPRQDAKETGIHVLGISIPISWNQLAITLGKTVLNQVVDSTVNWMNSGFDKNNNPAFVTDPGSFFGNIANGVVGEELDRLSHGVLCSPFQAKLIISIRQTNQGTQYSPQCTLSGIVKNYNNFINDFKEGGWDSFFAITQNDANNPFGAFINAELTINNKALASVNSATQEISWGSGFKSLRACKKYNGDGSNLQEWISNHLDDNSYPPGYDPKFAPGACIEYEPVSTPGATIKSHLDEALPANNYIRQIVSADQFDKLLTALGNGLLRRFVTGPEGLLGKASASSDTSGTGQTNPTAPVTCSPSTQRATAGEDVITWSANSSYDSDTLVSFVWVDTYSGADGSVNGKSGASATTTYNTKGIKTASVTASIIKLDDIGQPTDSALERTYQCANTVNVSVNHPLQVSCIADRPRITIPIGTDKSDPVTYTAKITGGSGVFTVIKWDGDQQVPPKASGLANTVFPYELTQELSNSPLITWCYGDTGGVNFAQHTGKACDTYFANNGLKGANFRTGVTQQKLTQDASSTPKLPVFNSTLSRIYFKADSGNLGAVKTTITVFDADELLEPITKFDCPASAIPVLDY